jgi:GNAT superfamily N-acetyltransferase
MGNLLAVTDIPPDPAELFDRAQKFFGPRTPWRVITTGDPVESVKRAAEQRGMKPYPCQPGMMLSPIPPAPAVSPPRSVRVASNAKELRDFQRTSSKGFGIPMIAIDMILPQLPGPVGQPGVPLFFVVYDGDKPVSASALLVSHGIAGIFFVSTIPRARKRGYATTAVWAAAEAGRKQGCEAAYLQASDMGRPVYERMGFHKVDDFAEWRLHLGGLGQIRAFFSIIGMVIRHHLGRRGSQPEGQGS